MELDIKKPFDEWGRSPAAQLFAHARSAMDDGKTLLALELLMRAAEEQPHFKTYELIGECYLLLERPKMAIPHFAAAVALNPGVKAAAKLSEAWMAAGYFREAIEAAEVALSRDPANRKAIEILESARIALETSSSIDKLP